MPLLALLKHPLAAAGLAPAACRAAARALELRCLRGPRPAPGLAGLRRALDAARGTGIGGRAAVCWRGWKTAWSPALRIASAVRGGRPVARRWPR